LQLKYLISLVLIPSLRSLGGFLPYAFSEQGAAMLSRQANELSR
jgi:hypothetical protein